MDNAPGLMAGFLIISLSLAVYFIPAIVALERLHHNRGAIFVLNLFLGWTLLGWVVALVWACMNPATAAAPLPTEVGCLARTAASRSLLPHGYVGSAAGS
jgi:hypothetical protein